MGVKALRKVQLGLESPPGQAVPTTTIWRGTGSLQDQREIKLVEEDVGYLSGTDLTYEAKQQGMITLEQEATFEQIPYPLSAGVENVVTGSEDGEGSGKIYTYTFPTTEAKEIMTYTIEGGDDVEAEQMTYCFVTDMKIAGTPNEAIKLSSDWIGQNPAPNDFTGSLDLPSVSHIQFGKGKLYIDETTISIGNTQKSNTLLGMGLTIKTGFNPVFTGDGNELYFKFHKQIPPEIELKITFEHDETSVAEKLAWREQTARLIRLQWEGAALTDPGTAYTYKTLRIDLAGKWLSFDKLDEQDGNDVVTGTFRARYNADADLFAQIVVVNELASLP